MTEPTKTPAENTSEGDGKNSKGTTEGAGTQTATTEDAPKFTQKDQDALAQKIRREEKEKHEKTTAEAKRLAEEAKAKEQGEFQKLAESRQTEIDTLKPQLEATSKELDAYKLKVSEMVAAKLKALPDEVRDMSPAQIAEDKSITNPLDVLAWLPKGEALALKLDGQPAKPNAGKDPKATGPGPNGQGEKDKKAQSAMASTYTRW